MRWPSTGAPSLAGTALALSSLVMVGCAATDPEVSIPEEEWSTSEVEVDGGRIAVTCRGDAGDGPAVLFVSGIGRDGKSGWLDSTVPARVSAGGRTCVYDRPGLGSSDPARTERSVTHHAEELDAVAAHVGPSVVLVAQGFGTFIARQFASAEPGMVATAGMVLVDPPLWTYLPEPPPGATEGQLAEYAGLAELDGRLSDFGPVAMPPPPVPVLVLGVDATRSDRPGGPPPALGTATDPPGTDPTGTDVASSDTPPAESTPESSDRGSDPAAEPEGSEAEPGADPEQAADRSESTSTTALAPGASGEVPSEPPPATVTEETEPPVEPPGTTPGTPLFDGAPGEDQLLTPPQDERDRAQAALAGKSPFGRFLGLDDAGSEAQFWDPERVASLIIELRHSIPAR